MCYVHDILRFHRPNQGSHRALPLSIKNRIWHYLPKNTNPEIHYNDVIMSAMTSQITSLTIVCSVVYSGADQRKHQSSASLAFVSGIHRWPYVVYELYLCTIVIYGESVIVSYCVTQMHVRQIPNHIFSRGFGRTATRWFLWCWWGRLLTAVTVYARVSATIN